MRAERTFGLLIGLVCGLIAAHGVWRARPIQTWSAGSLAAILLVLAAARPSSLRGPRRLWERLAHVLGAVNSRLLLTAMFFLVLTPVGFIARLLGWDPLGLRQQGRSTGWEPYAGQQQDPRHYERMY